MSHLALTLNCKLQSTAEERRGFPNSLIHIFRSLAAPIKPAASAEVDRKMVTGVANTPSAPPPPSRHLIGRGKRYPGAAGTELSFGVIV